MQDQSEDLEMENQQQSEVLEEGEELKQAEELGGEVEVEQQQLDTDQDSSSEVDIGDNQAKQQVKLATSSACTICVAVNQAVYLNLTVKQWV